MKLKYVIVYVYTLAIYSYKNKDLFLFTHSLHSLTSLTHSLTHSLTSLTSLTINFCSVDPLRATPRVDDQLERGRRALSAWCTEGLCDPAFFTRLSQCGLGLARFAPSPSIKKSTQPRRKWSWDTKNRKSCYLCWFWNLGTQVPNFTKF